MGIDVKVDAPEVGKNLQEHASVQTSVTVDIPTVNTRMGPLHIGLGLVQYLFRRRGIMTITPVEGMAFLRSQPDLATARYQAAIRAFCL